jgi:DNA-binding CsgD family transcriptional regulator
LLSEQRAAEMLGQLTAKQLEVLDRLARHLTTKEIARELDLAPNTVDQRITGVREKWGPPNRKALVRFYTELQVICGKTTYRSDPVDGDAADGNGAEDALQDEAVFIPQDQTQLAPNVPEPDGHTSELPFMLQRSDIRFGRLGRAAIALIFALMIALTLAAVVVVADTLGGWF